jgi:hypothetical protein
MGHNIVEVFVHTTEQRGRENYFVSDYQQPVENYFDMDTTNIPVDVCVTLILDYVKNINKNQ